MNPRPKPNTKPKSVAKSKAKAKPGAKHGGKATQRRASRILAPIPAGLVPPDGESQITAFRAVGEDGRVMAVHVGLRRVARVETDWLMSSGIHEGDPWTPAVADRLYGAAKQYAAYQHALHLTAAQQRSAFKLVQKLRHSGHDEPDARAAAERLVKLGLVRDDALAERLAEDLARSGKLGQRGIENKLRAKGIDPKLAKAAAESAAAEKVSPDAALTLARKRAPRLTDLAPQVARRRLYGFLVRRGFEHDEAHRATETALSEARAADLE